MNLIEQARIAGLRGLGGAAFPTADKLTEESGRSARNRRLKRRMPRTMSVVSSEMVAMFYDTHGV